MRLSQLATEESLERDGVWFHYGDGFRLRVGRLGSDSYISEFERIKKQYLHRLDRNGELPADLISPVLGLAAARRLVTDWEGLEDDQGEAVEYSKETAESILTDPRYRDLLLQILTFANNADNFRRMELEESAKNSLSTADGVDSTETDKT